MMKKYEKYKESGIEWIGKIPNSWHVSNIKFIAKVFGRIGYRGYTVDDLVEKGEGAISLSPSNIQNQLFDLTKRTYISWDKYEESPEIKVFEGDVILVKTASVGKVAYVDSLNGEKATINPQLVVFKEVLIDSKYFYYYLISKDFQHQIDRDNYGGVVGTLTQSSINSYKILIPPLSEQTAIARYLDHQTALIDQLIQQKEKLVALLKEKRQATINEAVTKGLNPNAKMKDSGIEWLGEVPEEWEVVKLKYLVSLNSNEEISIENSFKVALENIESGTGKFIESGSGNQFEGIGNSFKKGDVLFNKLRPYLSKVYLSQQDGYSVGELLVLTPNDAITSEFLFYRLLSSAFIEIVNSSTYGAKMPRASWNFIGNLLIPVPSIDEQLKIVSFIQNFDAKANNLITQTFTQISKLKEYRQSIISEAVTGKVDVREWAAGKKGNSSIKN